MSEVYFSEGYSQCLHCHKRTAKYFIKENILKDIPSLIPVCKKCKKNYEDLKKENKA